MPTANLPVGWRQKCGMHHCYAKRKARTWNARTSLMQSCTGSTVQALTHVTCACTCTYDLCARHVVLACIWWHVSSCATRALVCDVWPQTRRSSPTAQGGGRQSHVHVPNKPLHCMLHMGTTMQQVNALFPMQCNRHNGLQEERQYCQMLLINIKCQHAYPHAHVLWVKL